MNKHHFKYIFLMGLLLLLGGILVACGPTTVETTEAPPVATTAPTAVPPTAVPPTPTEDPTVKIMEVFAGSGHADGTAEAFIHWDEEEAIPPTCAKCHSEAGFFEYISTGAIAAGLPTPNQAFTCTTCHNDATETLSSVTFPSGIMVENLGAEAVCMTCHQGTESKVSVDAKLAKYGENLDPDVVPEALPPATADGKPTPLSFSNVHYFAAGGTLYGSQVQMGYQYDGKTYDIKNSHVAGFDTCIGCHDSHSLEVKVESCIECHTDVATVEDLKNIREPSSSKDYDGDSDVVEGVAMEIEGLQAILYASMQAYTKDVIGTPIVYSNTAYPYFFIDTNADGITDEAEAIFPNAYVTWTPRLLKAAYNYQVSVKDPGAYAHGGKYIIELLFDSIEDVNSAEKVVSKFDATTLSRVDTGHFDGSAEAWRHWDGGEEAAFEVPSDCATCHSSFGLPQIVMGEEVTAAPAGNGLMCQTCHDATAWPAVFAQADVTISSGKTVTFGDGNPSNTCLNCHSARTGKISVEKKITDFGVTDLDLVVEPITQDGKEVKFSFINSHYQGIAGLWFGTDAQVAYEYDGKTYAGTNAHPAVDGKDGCVACHDAHSGEIALESCTMCHAGTTSVENIRFTSDTTDWNGNSDVTESINSEISPIIDALYGQMQVYAKDKTDVGLIYRPTAYPYWYADADGDGEVDQVDGKNVQFSTWTARLLKAAYNYNFLVKTSGGYAHNADYVLQVAIDSIEDLGGDVSMYTRP